ncbi:YggN family protein [Photobacterium minamisatsumaniensis]|uniref:YggN family protein n=1 Tax=Photobacterium minamisatsumaniensis TaxID=2910233 RepID=UPI003D10C2E1
MRIIVIAIPLLVTSFGLAAKTCPVAVPNDIHISSEQVSVYQDGVPKMMIDEQYQLFINGEKIELSELQQQALEVYSKNVQHYLPLMADIADDGADVANGILQEISASFDSQASFENVESLIQEYSDKARQKFYQDDEFVMPAHIFEVSDSDWKQEFEQALQHISLESISSLFAALSEEMKNGEINFSELQTKFSELKSRLQEQVHEQSGAVADKANELCDSIKDLAEDEKELQMIVPELAPYPMFEI